MSCDLTPLASDRRGPVVLPAPVPVLILAVTLTVGLPYAALATPAGGGRAATAGGTTTDLSRFFAAPGPLVTDPVAGHVGDAVARDAGDAAAGDDLAARLAAPDPLAYTSVDGASFGFIDERGMEQSDGDTPLSRGRTILYSALLPGLGQAKWGHKGIAAAFFVGEAASWTVFVTSRVQGDARKDRYIEYAERFAGVGSAAGQSNSYYQALGRYDRSDPGPGSYNEIEVRLKAKRELYPNDPAAQERYIEENSITGDQAWNWESEARRREYSSIRSSSESAYHRSEFAVGGLVAGRILSVMHAVWMTADRSDDDEEKAQPNGVPNRDPHEQSLAASLAGSITPFATASLTGDYRLGFHTRF